MAIEDKTNIRRQTRAGYDRDGQRFKSYSKPTKKYKKSLGLGTSRVTLTDSGKMINSVNFKLTDNGYVMLVTDHGDIGYYHQEGKGNLPKREWFYPKKKQIDKFEKELKNTIDKQLGVK